MIDCSHTLKPGEARTITVTSTYSCIFCEREQLRATVAELRTELASLRAIVARVAVATNGYWNSPHAPSATEDLNPAEAALHEIANAIGEPF